MVTVSAIRAGRCGRRINGDRRILPFVPIKVDFFCIDRRCSRRRGSRRLIRRQTVLPVSLRRSRNSIVGKLHIIGGFVQNDALRGVIARPPRLTTQHLDVVPVIFLRGKQGMRSKQGVAGADAIAKDKTHLLKIIDGIHHIVLGFDLQRIARRVVCSRRPCLAAPSAIQIRIARTVQLAVQDHRVVDGFAVLRTPAKYTITRYG